MFHILLSISEFDSLTFPVGDCTLIDSVLRLCLILVALCFQEKEFRQKAEASLFEAWEIINSSGWKVEKKVDGTDDVVHSKQCKGKKKKLFRLTVSRMHSQD